MTTKTVSNKEEYKAKQQEMEREFKKKKKNPNHVVTPNLTPRGKDILMRLQNKSLDLEGDRSYTLNEDIVNARRMNKHQLMEAARQNESKIQGLQKTLNETNKKPLTKPKSNESNND